MPQLLLVLDLIGVAVFAISGAMVASRKEMDIFGFAVMAAVTGIGGGTLRDLVLGHPASWITSPYYLGVCLLAAVLVYFTAHVVQRRYVIVLWADAIGISAYAVMGADLALRAGADGLVAVGLGVISATFGGLIRDTIADEKPLILRKEVYATCTAAGAGVYVLLAGLGAGAVWAAALGFLASFVLRGLGIAAGLSLPTYRSRPGRIYR
jgi:uncharacterized membrane protein YeiH